MVVPLSQGLRAKSKTEEFLGSALASVQSETLSRNTLWHSILLSEIWVGRTQREATLGTHPSLFPSRVPQSSSKLRDKSGSKKDLPDQDLGFLYLIPCLVYGFVSEGTPSNEQQ